MKALFVTQALNALGSRTKALACAKYFKTGKGQYGYGDIFIGVTVPEERKVAKMFHNLSLSEIEKLLKSKIHEHRAVGLMILVVQFMKSDEKGRAKIVKTYLKNKKFINNWDLVDGSASYILGEYISNKNRDILYKLAKSKNVWERRIAIIATYYFIKKSDFKDTLYIAEILINDKHDLIHKAVGWMLREVGKKDEKVLKKFLDTYAVTMPRTALRYSLERFGTKDRLYYMKKKTPHKYLTNTI